MVYYRDRSVDKLTALKAFRRVAELRSFRQAARDLRLSTAAVSKNVRELESELGVRLLHRTTRTVNLTPTGEGYYVRVVDVLDRLTEADLATADLGSAPRGLLRVAAPMSLGIGLLAPAVARFAERYPDLRIELEMNDRYVDIVREGFDVAVRGGGPLEDSSLVARKLADLDRVVCGSPAYLAQRGVPRSPQDLAEHRCLVYTLSREPTRWTFRRGARERSVDVDGVLRVNNSLALVRAAVAGAGLARVPASLAREELGGGTLRPVLERWQVEPQALFALYPQHRESAPKVKLFVDHLVADLADERRPSPQLAARPRRSGGLGRKLRKLGG
jgi:DNA-binding transcriptional LysR family regulator